MTSACTSGAVSRARRAVSRRPCVCGRRRLRRLPAIVFVIAGVQISLDAFLSQHPGLLWNDGFDTSAFLKYLDGGTGRLSSCFPSLKHARQRPDPRHHRGHVDRLADPYGVALT
jgi:hypothetical protein